ncbi:endothelin-converting enzyme homolog [Patiria miniata]|uniref:Endothelin-converting enzyme 1 n=1 Tax=Patiria miniata TaxID=46514 RepID=A0A914BMM1_PATMI|nr:endothelin-converting enzyme homolog [Patiria miniata]
MADSTVNSVNADERTSPRAELTLTEDETVTKFPRKRLLVAVAVLSIAVLLAVCVLLLVLLLTKQGPNICDTEQCKQSVLYPTKPGLIKSSTEQTNQPVVLPTKPSPIICDTEQCNQSASNILRNMDKTQDPCHNFFEYACGGWNQRQVIPNNTLEVTRFSELDDDLKGKLKELIERKPLLNEPESFDKVRKFYNACLDLDTINGLGARPLTDTLQSLGGWPVLGSNPGGSWSQYSYNFESLWATLRSQYNIDAVISTGVQIDLENTRNYILQIDFPEFTVPLQFRANRQKRLASLVPESFSKDFGRHLLLLDELEDKRAAYLQYMIDIAVALGGDQSEVARDMNDAFEFEKTLAQHAEDAISDDSDLPVTKTLSNLQIIYSEVNWASLFRLLMPSSVYPPVSSYDNILVMSPSYLRSVAGLLRTKGHRVVANYMIWRLVNKMVPFLGEEYVAIHQKYLKAILGISAAPDRWKLCTEQVNTVLPFATGRMYVDEYFSTDTKTKTEEMVGQLRRALRAMFGSVRWLSYSDRTKARQKLDAMGVSVGYPDWLKVNYLLDAQSADLVVTTNSYFTNVVNYGRRVAQTQLGRLRLPVDKSLWDDSGPAVINAHYSLFENGIVIPAGILQPPFYHANMPWYSNFGGVGVVLGHEITHGFDSTGRLVDQHGNIENWWSYSSISGFIDAARCLVNQYSGFVMPENGKRVDGQLTEAENIADNGGLREAYKAYKTNRPSVQEQLPGLEDLTNDQLFFLSYSQVWCSVVTREGADWMVKYGVHSPGRFRVIGPLQNNENFHSAFGCQSGNYMYKSQYSTCKVWY